MKEDVKLVDAETKAEGMESLKRLPEVSLSADDSKMLSDHFFHGMCLYGNTSSIT